MSDVQDVLAQTIRVGFVTARQPEKMRVKVELKDTVTQPLVSAWLPVLCPRASGDLAYDLPDVGDQVLCLFLPYGLEQGFVVGAMYGKASPPVSSGDKWHRRFQDGTVLEYDRAAHKLTAQVQGDVAVTATGSVQAEATGDVSVSSAASLTLMAPAMQLGGTGGSTTQAAMQGTFRLENGDIIVEGVSFLHHVHDCPHGGQTGEPH